MVYWMRLLFAMFVAGGLLAGCQASPVQQAKIHQLEQRVDALEDKLTGNIVIKGDLTVEDTFTDIGR